MPPCAQIVRAAARTSAGGKVESSRQLRVGLVVARQQRSVDAVSRASARDLVDAIGPVAAAAEQPHDDELCASAIICLDIADRPTE